jgi:hypothetical protein
MGIDVDGLIVNVGEGGKGAGERVALWSVA